MIHPVELWRAAVKRRNKEKSPDAALTLQAREKFLRAFVRASLTVIDGGKPWHDTSSTSRPTDSSTN